MPTEREIEQLLARAAACERDGDRELAIGLYETVATYDSPHAAYAANCAAELREYDRLAGGPPPRPDGWAWRSGRLVVVAAGETLPGPCVMSGEPEGLTWMGLTFTSEERHDPLRSLVLWFLIGPFALLFRWRERVGVRVPVCEDAWRPLRLRAACYWLSWPAGVLAIYGAAAWGVSGGGVAAVCVAAILVPWLASNWRLPVRLKWCRSGYAAYAGAHEAYLKGLPPFPLRWRNGGWEFIERPSPPQAAT